MSTGASAKKAPARAGAPAARKAASPAGATRTARPAVAAEAQAGEKTAAPTRTRKRAATKADAATSGLSTTERVQAYRQRVRDEGGAELSMFLPRRAARALDVLIAATDKKKVEIVEAALISWARHEAPGKDAVARLRKTGRLKDSVGDEWLEILAEIKTRQA